MKAYAFGSMLLMASAFAGGNGRSDAEDPPAWAYPVDTSSATAASDANAPRHVPDSSVVYTSSQVDDVFLAPDWHPADHPAMPDIVAHGRKPDVYACGYCHRADGPGGPENASLAGLPAAYIAQQMADFKSGARTTAVPARIPPKMMMALSKSVSRAEVESAAIYFSGLAPRTNLRVVETNKVPKTRVVDWHLALTQDKAQEPIGDRIIEIPQDQDQFVSRDSHAGFIAYVPVGSIAKGKALVSAGGDSTPCASCHGPGLQGKGSIPGIAGRSPSYIVRQLFDFKHGERAGGGSDAMLPSVQQLTIADMVSIAAYTASLPASGSTMGK